MLPWETQEMLEIELPHLSEGRSTLSHAIGNTIIDKKNVILNLFCYMCDMLTCCTSGLLF